ncbi:MAG: RNA methyltransferase [Candidatus Cloacimonetes bacterium HGW-Cloacimonetes-3]|jgi:putative N6-adenine-specific DNA methylase|nr:MAG: RNA methyltransferase [Candidatus Cloacimonetes bacterium HGW-Cloacimonetes-3]
MEYIKTDKYFAQVAGSVEAYAKAELESMGAKVLQEVPRGIRFGCDKATLYRIVYCSRILQRVLAPLASFQCHSEKYLFSQASKILDWTALFSPDESFSIDCNVSNSHISHSLYAGQLLKDAICDSFRNKYGRRPDFKTQGADINFNLHIRDNWATIALDLTGISMHKRGYRVGANLAPLQETLAAAMVVMSGWKGDRPLLDPMCGSGTILAEALMRYCNIPSGYLRKDTGMPYLPDYDSELYAAIRKQENSRIIPLPKGLISGSDISVGSITYAEENLANLPGGENVELMVTPFQLLSKQSGRCIITNPPYGVRIGNDETTKTLYHDLGDFLKQKCPDSESYILCGSKELVPELHLRAYWKKSLKNGDLDTKLAKVTVR